ncbi:MAG: hypothetical protein ACK4GO_01465 [Gemmobacter sp.]
MPRLPLALAALLLSTPLHAQTAPAPATCPAGQIAAPDGTCQATRGIGGKGGTDGGKDAGGTRGGAGSDPKGGGGLMGTAGNPEV